MLDPEVLQSFFTLREAVNVQMALQDRMDKIQVALATQREVKKEYPELSVSNIVKQHLAEKRDLMKAHRLLSRGWKI
jgi:hypothetical protein